MGQINTKKVGAFQVPPSGYRGFGHDEFGNPCSVKEDGSKQILAANEILDVSDISPYDPIQSYLTDQYVSYSSENPEFSVSSIYLCIIEAAAGESPETNPEKWEYQGQQLGSMPDVVYVSTEQLITGRKTFSNRLLLNQPSDIASAFNLVLSNGFYFRIEDSSQETRLIDMSGWKGGSPFAIEFVSGHTIRHLYTKDGNNKPIRLAVGQDFVTTENIILLFVYDRISDIVKEIGGTSIAATTERSNYTAQRKQGVAFTVNSTTLITGFSSGDLNGCTVENNGSAGIQISGDEIQFTSSGSAYFVTIYDSEGNIKFLFPLIENYHKISNGAALTGFASIWDVKTKKMFQLPNWIGLTTHGNDQLMYTHNVGITIVTDSTNTYRYNIPYDLDSKQPIY